MSFISQSILGSSSNISNSDLTVTSVGTRFLRTGGFLSTDVIEVQDGAGDALVQFRGDGISIFPSPIVVSPVFSSANADLTLRPLPSSPNSRAIDVLPSSNTEGLRIFCNSLSNHKPLYLFDRVLNTATGTHKTIEIDSDSGSSLTNNRIIEINQSSGSQTNVGLYLDVRNGISNNYAIDIVNGDINTTGGIGQTGIYSFGGGSTGDVASLTFTKGILTGITIVP